MSDIVLVVPQGATTEHTGTVAFTARYESLLTIYSLITYSTRWKNFSDPDMNGVRAALNAATRASWQNSHEDTQLHLTVKQVRLLTTICEDILNPNSTTRAIAAPAELYETELILGNLREMELALQVLEAELNT